MVSLYVNGNAGVPVPGEPFGQSDDTRRSVVSGSVAAGPAASCARPGGGGAGGKAYAGRTVALAVATVLQIVWYALLLVAFPFAVWGAYGGDEPPGPFAAVHVRDTTVGFGVVALLPALLIVLVALGLGQRKLAVAETVIMGLIVACTVTGAVMGW